jgi:hypothetical protein
VLGEVDRAERARTVLLDGDDPQIGKGTIRSCVHESSFHAGDAFRLSNRRASLGRCRAAKSGVGSDRIDVYARSSL